MTTNVEPEMKNKLKEALAAANVRAEIEVYPNALHGWCVPDNPAANNKADAERAWGRVRRTRERLPSDGCIETELPRSRLTGTVNADRFRTALTSSGTNPEPRAGLRNVVGF